MSPELRQFLEYWHSLGGGSYPPERSALDLRQLAAILRWMFILEMDGSGTLKFRLAGSCLEDAIGCDMTDQAYSDILSINEKSAITAELYALCLVQGCGLLRSGTFTLGDAMDLSLQVLALPFADRRAMGGTVMVGAVRPFAFENQSFIDQRDHFDQIIDDLLVVPSPRVVTLDQISPRVRSLMVEQKIEFKALDLKKMLQADLMTLANESFQFPSFTLEKAAAFTQESLN